MRLLRVRRLWVQTRAARRDVDFRITGGEEQALPKIVRRLDAGNAPMVPETSDGLGRDAVRDDIESLKNLRFGRRGIDQG
ncbi:hypothetical protein GCM10010357_17780 [Streptomyces luteireticuli]|uniref:Uncharacterized protein n=1 Tax=Streptomyces luteireticuli TaxID=173858 RepID=A0ABN0YJ09_9ACTN